MTDAPVRNERFSGHESFVCRYGWLPKVYRAVIANPTLFRDEEQAMIKLGLGRNMVKSLQFWADVTGIVSSEGNGKYVPGPIGSLLFGEDGWDHYLESLESLWLIHWQLSTNAGLAAWNEIFGDRKTTRFDRQGLINALSQRASGLARSLASSTLEQHAGIFIQSYYQADRGSDDTSWSPLQDLGLIKATQTEDGRIQYDTDAIVPVGLSARVFGVALIDFLSQQGAESWSADFNTVLRGRYSPGVVFRLDEHQLRQLIDDAIAGPLSESLRFIDTADTQSIVLKPAAVAPQFCIKKQQEVLEHA